jgi:hypothetical protein
VDYDLSVAVDVGDRDDVGGVVSACSESAYCGFFEDLFDLGLSLSFLRSPVMVVFRC